MNYIVLYEYQGKWHAWQTYRDRTSAWNGSNVLAVRSRLRTKVVTP